MPKKSRPERVKIVTLGCPKNTVDSEAMMGILRKRGYALEENADNADTVVVNTCAFIDEAKEESIDAILEAGRWKEQDPSRRMIVAGCLAQRYADELAEEIPEADAFVGTSQFMNIPDALAQTRAAENSGANSPAVIKVSHPAYQYTQPFPRVQLTPWHYAYLKIGEGCDHRCTFCAIPSFRGKYASRPVETLVQEARELASAGVKELVLISQDTTWYGRDLYGECRLPQLLRALAKVNGIEWIRTLYLYPTLVDDALLNTIAAEEKALPYFDIPLQHIDDRILKRMGRATSEASIRRLIDRIRDRVPNAVLRTSFIVGFPGETDEAFEALLDFMIESEFEHCGVFEYSPEDGTPSAEWEGQVSAELKQDRLMELTAAQCDVARRMRSKRVGETARVMIDRKRPDTPLLEARTAAQAPEIDDLTLLRNCGAESGQFIDARIVEAFDFDLLAEPVFADA